MKVKIVKMEMKKMKGMQTRTRTMRRTTKNSHLLKYEYFWFYVEADAKKIQHPIHFWVKDVLVFVHLSKIPLPTHF